MSALAAPEALAVRFLPPVGKLRAREVEGEGRLWARAGAHMMSVRAAPAWGWVKRWPYKYLAEAAKETQKHKKRTRAPPTPWR